MASVHKNELVGSLWLLLDSVIDIVEIYLFCCGKSAFPEVDNKCAEIREQNEKSASSVRIANILLEFHCKILESVKDKLAPFIGNILKAPDKEKNIGGSICLWIHSMRQT